MGVDDSGTDKNRTPKVCHISLGHDCGWFKYCTSKPYGKFYFSWYQHKGAKTAKSYKNTSYYKKFNNISFAWTKGKLE